MCNGHWNVLCLQENYDLKWWIFGWMNSFYPYYVNVTFIFHFVMPIISGIKESLKESFSAKNIYCFIIDLIYHFPHTNTHTYTNLKYPQQFPFHLIQQQNNTTKILLSIFAKNFGPKNYEKTQIDEKFFHRSSSCFCY